jgi:hypothetical protein
VLGAAEEDDEDDGGELEELEELDDPDPPHPASASPTTVSARAAILEIDLLDVAVSIIETSRVIAVAADVLPTAYGSSLSVSTILTVYEGQDVPRRGSFPTASA